MMYEFSVPEKSSEGERFCHMCAQLVFEGLNLVPDMPCMTKPSAILRRLQMARSPILCDQVQQIAKKGLPLD